MNSDEPGCHNLEVEGFVLGVLIWDRPLKYGLLTPEPSWEERVDLDRFREGLGRSPATNQIEYHPPFQPEDRLEHAREHGYPLVAYSPLAGGRVSEIDEVVAVAEKHGVSPEQASLAWLLAKGIHPIPKASSRTHLESNRAALDVKLDETDVARIDGVEHEEELHPE